LSWRPALGAAVHNYRMLYQSPFQIAPSNPEIKIQDRWNQSVVVAEYFGAVEKWVWQSYICYGVRCSSIIGKPRPNRVRICSKWIWQIRLVARKTEYCHLALGCLWFLAADPQRKPFSAISHHQAPENTNKSHPLQHSLSEKPAAMWLHYNSREWVCACAYETQCHLVETARLFTLRPSFLAGLDLRWLLQAPMSILIHRCFTYLPFSWMFLRNHWIVKVLTNPELLHPELHNF